jgi:hypothetical protein
MAVALSEWTRLLRWEYLDEFIGSGGSAVKIAVSPSEQIPEVLEALLEAATDAGYPVIGVDAAGTRLHRIDALFFAVAQQMDWDALAERWMRDHLAGAGITLSPGQPLRELDRIAEANGQRRADLLALCERIIANGILRDYALSREFRLAMDGPEAPADLSASGPAQCPSSASLARTLDAHDRLSRPRPTQWALPRRPG